MARSEADRLFEVLGTFERAATAAAMGFGDAACSGIESGMAQLLETLRDHQPRVFRELESKVVAAHAAKTTSGTET